MGLASQGASTPKPLEIDLAHEEFVELLETANAAIAQRHYPRAAKAFERLMTQAAAHFAQEEAWMVAIAHRAREEHAKQHATVLKLMRGLMQLLRQEQGTRQLALVVCELANWFPQHARNMDPRLADHLAETGLPHPARTASRRRRAASAAAPAHRERPLPE